MIAAPSRRPRTDARAERRARLLGVAAQIILVWICCGARAAGAEMLLAGSLQSQNLVRHADVDEHHFIQQRNTVHLRAMVDLARAPYTAHLTRRLLARATLMLQYRSTYDSIYEYAPTARERDLRGRKPGPAADRDLGDLSRAARDAIKLESQLRQAYLDATLHALPLRVRIGKQQIVWGEADFFRMLDRANPLDLSWHGAQELPPPAFGWDDLRIPLWMLRLWYRLGSVGVARDLMLETYWNPGDWRPARVSFLPRPWGIRLSNPLTNREDGAFHAPFPGIRRLANGTSLFRQGPYSRNPLENSQVGVRLSTALPHGLRIGLHYFHQRWAGDDGTPFAPARGIAPDAAGQVETQRLLGRGTLPVEYVTPYIHTIGLTANYFDARHTATTYRLETVVDLDLPLFDRAKETTFSPLLPGTATRDYWKAMLAFDRPTMLPWLRDASPVFLTGQAFVHHLIGDASSLVGPLDLPTAGSRSRPYCGAPVGTPCTDPAGNGSLRDDVRSWESLLTLAILTFLRGQSIVPVLGLVVDPVNSFGMNVFWSLDARWTSSVTVTLTQRLFVSAQDDVQKGPFDPWHVGTQRGRSETGLRVTYTF